MRYAALLGIALALALGAPRAARAQLLSPGPLAQAHASVDGDDHCARCHESGKRVVARLCLDCHKDLGAALAARRGLHGKQYQGQPCEHCHVEDQYQIPLPAGLLPSRTSDVDSRPDARVADYFLGPVAGRAPAATTASRPPFTRSPCR